MRDRGSGDKHVGAMSGTRVLELGRHLGVASTGLSLAALGADVAQVRHPERRVSPADSAYYDRGRTLVDLDPSVRVLAAAADVLVTDLADDELAALGLPVDEQELRGGPTPQVLVTIRSFGRSGPNRDLRMTDLTEWAAGGLAPVTRRPHPGDAERYTPVLPPGCQPQALAGIAAATAAIVGRRAARSHGRPVVADVSVQEVVAAMLHGISPHFAWLGIIIGHASTPASARGLILPAVDGDVYLRVLDPRQWDALVTWVGDDTLQVLGAEPNSRLANHDALELVLSAWSVTQKRQDLFEEGQRRRIPIALPRSIEDVLAWQHLRARGTWREIELGDDVVEVPRLPLLEPSTWRPTAQVAAADLLTVWAIA
jgi:crotonobetainyl-CoA:carnitine CoA-transferase CaiB-like acyl-CoA transferase